jgi:hypothetical protein
MCVHRYQQELRADQGICGAHQESLELAAQLHEPVLDGLLLRRGRAARPALLQFIAYFVLSLLVLRDLIFQLFNLSLDEGLVWSREAFHNGSLRRGGAGFSLAVRHHIGCGFGFGHAHQCMQVGMTRGFMESCKTFIVPSETERSGMCWSLFQ